MTLLVEREYHRLEGYPSYGRESKQGPRVMTFSVSRYNLRKVEGATQLLLLSFLSVLANGNLYLNLIYFRRIRRCCIMGPATIPVICIDFRPFDTYNMNMI